MKLTLNRRSFVKYSLAGAALTLTPELLRSTALAAPSSKTDYKQTRLILGTFVSITVAHKDEAFAQQAIDAAFMEVERLNAIFNRHDASSPIAVLNLQGALRDAPAELCALVKESVQFGHNVNGSFNIAVAPVLDMLATTSGTKQDLQAAAALADTSAITVGSSKLRFERSGMAITLDGIAKGLIVDKAAEVLLRAGADNHLINAGGDVYASGLRADGKAWRVAVESPAKDGNYPAVCKLSGRAMATSGSYENFFDSSRKLHHLIKPGQSVSPLYYSSVSAQAPTAKLADAMATALSIMPLADAKTAVHNYTGCAAMFIDNKGNKHFAGNWA